ncbi:MAG: TatD family hydrolase [Helicobacteraceae bacterium]|jgi:TatD DNase family protein|nr:TatD family hydrolase [Helicobacteraceae bacterium]
MIIDTHTHLDRGEYKADLEDTIARAKAANVGAFVIPGADPRDLARAQSIAQRYENIYFAVGAHPYDVDFFDEAAMSAFLEDPKCVAIGECGLDYFRLPKDPVEAAAIKAKQKSVFERQIGIANERDLPLIVHIRDAASDALSLLEATRTIGVLHCFSGERLLTPLAKRGYYFGIGGALTFANAQNLRDCVADLPLENIVLETDAPFLAPTPHRGKRNESAYLPLVAAKLAEIKSESIETVIEKTTQNAIKLFHLPPLPRKR